MFITAVSHDAGGAELISNYLKNKKKVQFVLKGPAKKIFKNNIKNPHLISLKKAMNNSELVICGTSSFSDLEKKAIIQCRKNKIKVVSWLDSWTNYKERFLLNNCLNLPDEIWVSDNYAYKTAKKIFQNVKILKKKNYYLKNIKKELKIKKIKKIKNILYVCGLMNRNKMLNKLEKISFFNFFKILKKKYYKSLNVVLRYHPAESNFFDQKIIKKLNIKISKNKIIDDFNWSDIIVGATTMAFYVAKGLNLHCYSSIPSKYKMKNIDGSINFMKFSLLTRKKLFYEN
jgi:hypothetical protein